LYNAHAEEQEETDLEMVEPSTVLQQIIHWTDPANVVNQTEENISQSRTHLILGIDLLNSLNEVKSKKFRKLVLTNISTLSIGSALSYKDLKSLKETIDDKEEFISESDQATKNRVNKLLNKLEPLLAEAETKHEPTQVEIEDNAKDQEYSQILENPHFKTENSNDEVDEEYEEEQSRMLQEVSLHYEDAEGDEGQAHNVEITANDISKIIDEDGDLSME
jgi:condensin complex subunit 3